MATAERYPVPSGQCRVEEVIKGSRFITSMGFTESEQDARLFVEKIRGEYPDSSHNCWAYLIGRPGSSGKVGLSDDGEPHGTAGRPMLTVLSHCGVGDVTAVVTRYFGGTKLGKGGLARAYSSGVKNALEILDLTEHITFVSLVVVIDYPRVSAFQRLISEYEAQTVSEDFGAEITFELKIPDSQIEPFRQAVSDLTNGSAQIALIEPE